MLLTCKLGQVLLAAEHGGQVFAPAAVSNLYRFHAAVNQPVLGAGPVLTEARPAPSGAYALVFFSLGP